MTEDDTVSLGMGCGKVDRETWTVECPFCGRMMTACYRDGCGGGEGVCLIDEKNHCEQLAKFIAEHISLGGEYASIVEMVIGMNKAMENALNDIGEDRDG